MCSGNPPRGKMKPLNVLQFICPAGLFGAEMWILALARSLDSQHIRSHLAVSHESESQNLQIVERYDDLGLPTHKLPMKGRFDPAIVLRLVHLIRFQKIHIIHTHGYKSDILGLMAAKIAGIQSIATPHGFENVKDIKLQSFIALGCMAFRYFDKVAPLSDKLFDDIRGYGVPLKKIQLIQNGVDLHEIEQAIRQRQAPPFPFDAHEKLIGYVGQLAHRKNVGALLTVFDRLYQEDHNVRLILVGEGPMRKALEEKAASLASARKITFLGYRSDRLQIVRQLDLFSMTSTLEGIPRCMMEAMALGIPVAAYEIPGVDKLILNGRTGLMADFGDVKGLKQCWERLLFDKPFAQTLAARGRAHIHNRFSGYRMAKEYTKLYKNMVRKIA